MEAIKERERKELRAELAELLTWQECMLVIYHAGKTFRGYRRDAGGALNNIRLKLEELRRKIAKMEPA